MRIQIIRKRTVKYIKISLLIIRPEIINQAAKPGIGCRFEDHITLFQHVSPYTSGNLVPGAGDQCNSAPKPRRLRRLLRQVTLELSQNGVTSMFTQADVTKQEQWRDSAAAVIKEYGHIDVLVNNTGIFKDGSALTSSEEDFKRIMDVNVNGVYLGMQAVLPQMIRQQKGSVINIASETGLIAIANQIAYNTSKAAVIMMTKSVAVDFAADGIRANCIVPGVCTPPLFSVSSTPPKIMTRSSSLCPKTVRSCAWVLPMRSPWAPSISQATSRRLQPEAS